MSPEAIQLPNSVDACSDLYAVGAVGYFLLTGHCVFEAESMAERCQRHISEPPETPSQRLARIFHPYLLRRPKSFHGRVMFRSAILNV